MSALCILQAIKAITGAPPQPISMQQFAEGSATYNRFLLTSAPDPLNKDYFPRGRLVFDSVACVKGANGIWHINFRHSNGQYLQVQNDGQLYQSKCLHRGIDTCYYCIIFKNKLNFVFFAYNAKDYEPTV